MLPPPIYRLPIELKISILKAIDDLSTLAALIQFSLPFRQAFKASPVDVLESIQRNEELSARPENNEQGCVADALMYFRTSRLDVKEVEGVVQFYVKTSEREGVNSAGRVREFARYMSEGFSDDVIDALIANHKAVDALRDRHVRIMLELCSDEHPPTVLERMRVRTALYRFGVFANLFRDRDVRRPGGTLETIWTGEAFLRSLPTMCDGFCVLGIYKFLLIVLIQELRQLNGCDWIKEFREKSLSDDVDSVADLVDSCYRFSINDPPSLYPEYESHFLTSVDLKTLYALSFKPLLPRETIEGRFKQLFQLDRSLFTRRNYPVAVVLGSFAVKSALRAGFANHVLWERQGEREADYVRPRRLLRPSSSDAGNVKWYNAGVQLDYVFWDDERNKRFGLVASPGD